VTIALALDLAPAQVRQLTYAELGAYIRVREREARRQRARARARRARA
jgi:hypothetical protein